MKHPDSIFATALYWIHMNLKLEIETSPYMPLKNHHFYHLAYQKICWAMSYGACFCLPNFQCPYFGLVEARSYEEHQLQGCQGNGAFTPIFGVRNDNQK
jgi:hypothetical protein